MDKASINLPPGVSVIREIYLALGFERDDFARVLGFDRNTIYRWESGFREPRLTPAQISILDLHLKRLGLRFSDLPTDWSRKRQ